MVEARGLVKRYPQGDTEIQVLQGIDLRVKAGEWVSIMGPSGSGKSTLLNLIGLLDAPSGGALSLRGADVTKLSANAAAVARRDTLGFVFQSFNLMPRMTAMQNVMLPMAIAGVPRGARKARAARILTSVGLAEQMHKRPNQMSGGQRQRVAIARALALDPPILLADEPTGNLDSKTGTQIMDLFGRLHKAGKTIIQVTHDESVAHYAQTIVRVRDGRIETREPGRGSGAVLFKENPILDARVVEVSGKGALGGHTSGASSVGRGDGRPAGGDTPSHRPADSIPRKARGGSADQQGYPHPMRKRDGGAP